MATSTDKHDLIDDIKYPYRNYRFKVYGHGGDSVLWKVDKHGFDYWNRQLQKNPSAVSEYYANADDMNLIDDIPPYARFLQDRNFNKVGLEFGVELDNCDITITQTDGDSIWSNNARTIVDKTPVLGLNLPILYQEKTTLPNYVVAHNRHDVGVFCESVLMLDHKFDIQHLKLKVLERAKGDVVLKGLIYKDKIVNIDGAFYGNMRRINETTNIWKT
jgi:hypothetical protein